MKYVSIDIETTGLNPETCQILSIGAVVDNGGPFDSLPCFHCYIQHEVITGEAFGLQMNHNILYTLATRGEQPDGVVILPPEVVPLSLHAFLFDNLGCAPYNVAGKNFAGFDLQFLQRLPAWGIKFRHRVLDPGPMYLEEGDGAVPGLSQCLRRAGIKGPVTHDAVQDAKQVIQVIRRKHPWIVLNSTD